MFECGGRKTNIVHVFGKFEGKPLAWWWNGSYNTLLKYHASTPCYSLSMPSIEYLCEQKWVLKMSKNFHR